MLVKSQMSDNSTKVKGLRYLNDIKQFALSIYFLGPKVYNLLQNPLSLPTSRTLRRVTLKYELNPGLNDFLFNFVPFKICNFKSDALDCILWVDLMALKTSLYYHNTKDKIIDFQGSNSCKKYEPDKYALDFMIRGLNCE